MSIAALDINQLYPRICGELGVQAYHLNRKGDLVDNALPGRLPLAPKLKVFGAVVRSVAGFVVDFFTFDKRTPKHPLHDNAMFVDGLTLPVDGDRADYSGVTVFAKVPASLAAKESLDGSSPRPCVSAILRAKTLIANVCACVGFSSRFVDVNVPPHRGQLSALFAGEKGGCGISRSRVLSPALSRAICRVFAEFLSVVANVTGWMAKSFAAIAAIKIPHLNHQGSRCYVWYVNYATPIARAQYFLARKVIAQEI